MLLDQTRFKSFWQNPERYRLQYEKMLEPRAGIYGIQRGTAFHLIKEGVYLGASQEEIAAILSGAWPNYQGQTLQLAPEAIEAAWAMWRCFERTYPSGCEIEVESVEYEFKHQVLPDSPHFAVGRIDEILTYHNTTWVGEAKTAYGKANYDRLLDDWAHDAQADFVILGARELGYDVNRVLVRVVVERIPPMCFPPIEVKRSEHQLSVMSLNIHQTCEIIEMMRHTFGIDVPWPHLSNWPCNVLDKCEFNSLCGRATSEIEPDELAPFKEREEWLELMRVEKAQSPVLCEVVAK
jgi:hypothetical protein